MPAHTTQGKTHRHIGIYGGSFNPIHDGHTRLGKQLCEMGLVDELWFVVSPMNPLKQGTDLLCDEARLHLARLAVQDTDQRLHVCDVEMHMPRPSYMAHTLTRLGEMYPDYRFTLVIGADNWLRFPQWHDHEGILRRHEVLIYPRPGFSIEPTSLPTGVRLVDTPLIPLSSTDIRTAIGQGGYDGQGLSPAVWAEIQRMGYYQ